MVQKKRPRGRPKAADAEEKRRDILKQAAALFAPARTGELALPWLLARETRRSFSSNVGTLLAALFVGGVLTFAGLVSGDLEPGDTAVFEQLSPYRSFDATEQLK